MAGAGYLTPAQYVALKSYVEIMFQISYSTKLKAIDNFAPNLVAERKGAGKAFSLGLVFDPSPVEKRALGSTAKFYKIAINDFQVPFAQFDHNITVDLDDYATMTEEAISQASAGAEKYSLVIHNEVSDICRLGDTAAYLMPTGKFFFDANIPVGLSSNVFTNLLVGVLNDVNLAAGIAAMAFFPMDDGTETEIEPNWLVVPSTLKARAWELTKSKYIDVTTTTAGPTVTGFGRDVAGFIGTMQVGSSARLRDTNDWYLYKSGDDIRPIRWVVHEKLGMPGYTVNDLHDISKTKKMEFSSFIYANAYPWESRLAIKYANP